MDGVVGRQRHGEALRGFLGNFGKFLRGKNVLDDGGTRVKTWTGKMYLGNALSHCEGVVELSKRLQMDDACRPFLLSWEYWNHDVDDR
jgi:hypothetical protein